MNYKLMIENLSKIYNKLSYSHDQEREKFYDNSQQLNMLVKYLPYNATVLDAGCGTGYPVLKFFHDLGYDVTGTDISPGQLELVKKHAPFAKTLICDTSELNFSENTFNLITSFYSLMHLPVDKQIQAFERFFKMLKDDGYLFITLASEKYTGKTEYAGNIIYEGNDFPIFHTTPERYKEILENIGFTTLNFDHKVTGKDINFLWYYGKK